MTARDDARDELAKTLEQVDTHTYEALASNLLAAGYSKPRTITTAEELDALAVGSVVLADGYRHHANDMPIAFQRWSDGDWHRGARSGNTHPDNIVPATVLYTPEES